MPSESVLQCLDASAAATQHVMAIDGASSHLRLGRLHTAENCTAHPAHLPCLETIGEQVQYHVRPAMHRMQNINS
jgi:hypothetical protein